MNPTQLWISQRLILRENFNERWPFPITLNLREQQSFAFDYTFANVFYMEVSFMTIRKLIQRISSYFPIEIIYCWWYQYFFYDYWYYFWYYYSVKKKQHLSVITANQCYLSWTWTVPLILVNDVGLFDEYIFCSDSIPLRLAFTHCIRRCVLVILMIFTSIGEVWREVPHALSISRPQYVLQRCFIIVFMSAMLLYY